MAYGQLASDVLFVLLMCAITVLPFVFIIIGVLILKKMMTSDKPGVASYEDSDAT